MSALRLASTSLRRGSPCGLTASDMQVQDVAWGWTAAEHLARVRRVAAVAVTPRRTGLLVHLVPHHDACRQTKATSVITRPRTTMHSRTSNFPGPSVGITACSLYGESRLFSVD